MLQMLHAKPPEPFILLFLRRFLKDFTIYGRSAHLGHVSQMQQTNFHSLYQLRLHVKFGFDWPSGFWEELKSFPYMSLYKQVNPGAGTFLIQWLWFEEYL